MAKYAGEQAFLEVETTPGGGTYALIGAASEHTLTINNEQVDTTDKDSNRWGETKNFGKRSATIAFSGFVSDNANFALLEAAVESDTILNYRFNYGNSKTITGAFHANGLEYSSPNNDAQKFSVTLTSDGTPTFA